jgi:hypothetical protein
MKENFDKKFGTWNKPISQLEHFKMRTKHETINSEVTQDPNSDGEFEEE